ncbi:olfactory receptor 5AR1-like [Strix uralensis]|uniref:olfactory receptor 5AR1-like n=1 Tax=Strix uralensis TaxID=36305 RepID=UPI003DA61824
MAGGNHSSVTEFVLLGFTDLQELLFVIFLLIYITTLVGNMGMIVLIKTNSQLHVPMYFFLSHLSFLDVCYSSSISPKLLLGFLAERNIISFNGCITQFFFFAIFGTTEAILLAVMAYDRFVAICEPLHYLAAMSHGVGVQLVVGSYAAGILNALVHTSTLLRLSFCGPNLINHFYCDIPPLLLLSCSDTWLNKVVMASCIGFIITTSVLAIGISYTCILFTTWSIRSVEGRHKAFSTCSSHLMAVALFYGSAAFLYFHSFSRHVEDQGKTASVFYTVVTPMLNPFIYSLRNKEINYIFQEIRDNTFLINQKLRCEQTGAGEDSSLDELMKWIYKASEV